MKTSLTFKDNLDLLKHREEKKINSRKQILDDLICKKRQISLKNSNLEIVVTDLELPSEANYFDINGTNSIDILKELLIQTDLNFVKFALYKIREYTRVGENPTYFIELFTNTGIVDLLAELLSTSQNMQVLVK